MIEKLTCITETDYYADIVGGPLNGKRYLKGKEGEVRIIRKLGWYKFINEKWIFRPQFKNEF